MKKILVVSIFTVMLAVSFLSVSVMAAFEMGPAPNSGDGVSDGSGADSPFYNGEPVVDSPGPAPNSGDGIPDGSGF